MLAAKALGLLDVSAMVARGWSEADRRERRAAPRRGRTTAIHRRPSAQLGPIAEQPDVEPDPRSAIAFPGRASVSPLTIAAPPSIATARCQNRTASMPQITPPRPEPRQASDDASEGSGFPEPRVSVIGTRPITNVSGVRAVSASIVTAVKAMVHDCRVSTLSPMAESGITFFLIGEVSTRGGHSSVAGG